MRRAGAVLAALVLAATACAGGSDDERLVLVDYSHDVFASALIYNFPGKVTVRPGQTLIFRQTWTGEPHTVTGGRLVDENIEAFEPWMSFFGAYDALLATGADIPDPDRPGDATFAGFAAGVQDAEDAELREGLLESYANLRTQDPSMPDMEDPPDMSFADFVELIDERMGELFGALPHPFDEENNDIAQNVGQPCYLKEGGPPAEPQTACDPEDQVQPPFDGTYSYYNSGLLPYDGPRGNTFRVPLSEDIEPGIYNFYCTLHGAEQRTMVEVVGPGSDVPSPQDLARQSRQEISRVAGPLTELYQGVLETNRLELPNGEEIEGPFAGLAQPGSESFAAVNEFVPRRIEVEAGEPITWQVMGLPHTISFDVPEYFPVFSFEEDGAVRINPMLEPAAGGAPDPYEAMEGSEDGSIDGGSYDGEGFWSSGMLESWMSPAGYVSYTLRITEPGTYRYACLTHPPMVGTVVVR